MINNTIDNKYTNVRFLFELIASYMRTACFLLSFSATLRKQKIMGEIVPASYLVHFVMIILISLLSFCCDRNCLTC